MAKRNITVKEKELIDKLNNRGASSAETQSVAEKQTLEPYTEVMDKVDADFNQPTVNLKPQDDEDNRCPYEYKDDSKDAEESRANVQKTPAPIKESKAVVKKIKEMANAKKDEKSESRTFTKEEIEKLIDSRLAEKEDTRLRTPENTSLTLKEKDGSTHYLSLLQLGNLISSIIDAKTRTKHHCACDHDHEAPKAEGKEQVNHPDHYNDYDVEVIEMMERVFGHEAVVNFCRLNAFKYRMRAGHKDGNSLEQDLKKERWYLDYIKNHEK